MPDFPRGVGLDPTVWTNARAGNLDEIVNSTYGLAQLARRAEYTAARATLLDNLDALISSRMPTTIPSQVFPFTNPASALDLSNMQVAGLTPTRSARLDSILAGITPIEGTASPAVIGTAIDVVRQELGVMFFLEGFIDLNAMASGDSVTIAEQISLVTPVAYRAYRSEVFDGVQAEPALYVITKPARYGLGITLNQTVGTLRTFPYQFFVRRVA